VKVLGALGLLVAGAATGIAAVALHSAAWGLLLGVLASGAALVALPAGWWARTSYGLGWVAMVGYLSSRRGEGDYVISSDGPGYVLLGFAAVVLVVSVATLPRPARVDVGNGRSAS
jgi:hypothetical protein